MKCDNFSRSIQASSQREHRATHETNTFLQQTETFSETEMRWLKMAKRWLIAMADFPS